MNSVSEFQIEFKNEVFVIFFFWYDIWEKKKLRKYIDEVYKLFIDWESLSWVRIRSELSSDRVQFLKMWVNLILLYQLTEFFVSLSKHIYICSNV